MSLSPAELAYQEAHINDNLQPSVIIATAICLAGAYVSVVLRFASRFIGHTPLGKDDYTIVLALIPATAFSALVIALTNVGLGKHIILLTPAKGIILGKEAMAAQAVLNLAIFTSKLSILLLYHRLFGSSSRKFTIALWASGGFVAAWTFAGAMVIIFQCTPVKAAWDPFIPHTCINFDIFLTIISLINVFSDVLILCLPLPLLWRLQTTPRRKWQLIGMFMMGSLVCIGSVVRTIYASEASLTDESWDDTKPALWSMIETNLAIVSACLPTYRPLGRVLFGIKSNSNGTSSHKNSRSKSIPLSGIKSTSTVKQTYGPNFGKTNPKHQFVELSSGVEIEISAGQRSDGESV
ncbi:hypothetical protein N431DRAFT_450160 [Stipitochalara longipes BDJ]|nr:hypothetical protein N431DRAFT_450160 [Stipitochalara longipes BDJ]